MPLTQDETEKAAAVLLLTVARVLREDLREGPGPGGRRAKRMLAELDAALAPFADTPDLSHRPGCAVLILACDAECDCGAWERHETGGHSPPVYTRRSDARAVELGSAQGDFAWLGQLCSKPAFAIKEALLARNRWVRTDLHVVAEERLAEAMAALEAIPFADVRLSEAGTNIAAAQRVLGKFVDAKLRERLTMDAAAS